MNAEKTRGTSMDVGSKTHHHQTASMNKQSGSRQQSDFPENEEKNRTTYGKTAFERTFRTQGRGDSRAISALDAKLNAMQNMIYGGQSGKTNTLAKKK